MDGWTDQQTDIAIYRAAIATKNSPLGPQNVKNDPTLSQNQIQS